MEESQNPLTSLEMPGNRWLSQRLDESKPMVESNLSALDTHQSPEAWFLYPLTGLRVNCAHRLESSKCWLLTIIYLAVMPSQTVPPLRPRPIPSQAWA